MARYTDPYVVAESKVGKAPCMGCAMRTVGCHSTCGLYLNWRKEFDKERNKYVKERDNQFNADCVTNRRGRQN